MVLIRLGIKSKTNQDLNADFGATILSSVIKLVRK